MRYDRERGLIESYRGSVVKLDVNPTGALDNNLTGAVVKFTAKRNWSDPDVAAVVSLSSPSSGVTIPSADLAQVRVPAADTEDLVVDDAVELVWDVTAYKAGDKFTLAAGQWIIHPSATRAAS